MTQLPVERLARLNKQRNTENELDDDGPTTVRMKKQRLKLRFNDITEKREFTLEDENDEDDNIDMAEKKNEETEVSSKTPKKKTFLEV